jgi:SAM-dependent methyltransferase
MRILDVGCGRGQLLSILHRAGFRHLLGVDPYLSAEVQVADGVRVLNCPVQSVEGQFDCIMLHHVFEHLENGLEMLIRCRERLAPGGKLLLRFPTVECDAWERYGEHWVALDAPRHLLLPTRRSLEILVPQAGLRMVECWCDSTAFQFVGSELYLQGLPLADAQGRPTPITDHFTAKQLKHFERQAQSLNASNRGDQLAVLLEV